MDTLVQICLVLHIAGITILAGTTLVNYIISKQFWKNVQMDMSKAIVINSTTLVVERITAIGGMLTVLSGIGMVVIFHGAFNSQLWFQVKMILLLLIIFNALLFARPLNNKLKNILSKNINVTNELEPLKIKMNVYYLLQLSMLLIIFILSVFKFS